MRDDGILVTLKAAQSEAIGNTTTTTNDQSLDRNKYRIYGGRCVMSCGPAAV